MTKSQFHKKYGGFQSRDEAEVIALVAEANAIGIDGDSAAYLCGGLIYRIVLKSFADKTFRSEQRWLKSKGYKELQDFLSSLRK
jgi:hypothetical protein